MRIRPACGADGPAVRVLLERCFPGGPEAALVEALDAGGHVGIALLAEDPQPIGYALLSRMASPAGTLGLGPVATDPDWRRRGAASALVRDGLERARAQGWQGVFVLGEPGFYERFGFAARTAQAWQSPYAGPCFMAVELRPGGLAGGGQSEYAEPFTRL